MHDNPGIWPTLPSRDITEDEKRLMLDPVRGTEWQTCWEYKLSHTMTEAEGAAFWTGANLAMEAIRSRLTAVEALHQPYHWRIGKRSGDDQRIGGESPGGRGFSSTKCAHCHGFVNQWPCPTLAALTAAQPPARTEGSGGGEVGTHG